VNLFIQTNSFSVDSRARAGPGGPTKSVGRAGPGPVVVGEGRAGPGGPQHFLGRFGPGPTAKNGPISRPDVQGHAYLSFRYTQRHLSPFILFLVEKSLANINCLLACLCVRTSLIGPRVR
jgi:hypothetical protein